jgi:hypothetical protein
MAERHNMAINASISTAEGEKFMDASVTYYGLKYDQMVGVEGVLVKALGDLVEIAKVEAESRKEADYGENPNGLIKSR